MQVARTVRRQDDDRWVRRAHRSELGDRYGGLTEQLEQECLEVVVGAVDLVDQEYRGTWAWMLERLQQRPADQVLGTEQGALTERFLVRLGQPDAQQLAWVVPFVERLRGVDPVVALEPH